MSNEEISEYYDKQVDRKLHDYYYGNKRIELAWNSIRKYSPEKLDAILEVGCGVGFISNRMAKKWTKSIVYGLDISHKSIQIAKSLFHRKNLNFMVGPQEGKLLDQKFDYIILMDVYEHIPIENRPFINFFIKNQIGNNGRIFISFPTPKNLDWLRKNKPQELQIIDERITIDTLSEIANDTETTIIYYKEIDVWRTKDYAHVVLEKFPSNYELTFIKTNRLLKIIYAANSIYKQFLYKQRS